MTRVRPNHLNETKLETFSHHQHMIRSSSNVRGNGSISNHWMSARKKSRTTSRDGYASFRKGTGKQDCFGQRADSLNTALATSHPWSMQRLRTGWKNEK